MSKKNKAAKKEKKSKKLESVEKVTVFKQFKKQQIFKQVSFVMVAFVAALGINFFVLNGDYGNQLKVNILESQQAVEQKSDIYIENIGETQNNILIIKSGKKMDRVTSLSLGIIYNAEVVAIQDMFSKINGLNLERLENEPGTSTLLLNFDEAQDIQQGEEIIHFYLSKKVQTTQHINIINSNFTDGSGTHYQLSTSGIAF